MIVIRISVGDEETCPRTSTLSLEENLARCDLSQPKDSLGIDVNEGRVR